MSATFKAACLQVNASNDMQANIDCALDLISDAAEKGAQMIMLPENVAMMEWGRDAIIAKARSEADHPALAAFRAIAQEKNLWLHCGSLAILPQENSEMVANRTFVIDPHGSIVGRYDKIHMFDVDLDGGERYRESATFQAGDQASIVQTPWGGLGLSICYDVRFPHLYRHLAKAGADFLAVPAAFTRTTGQAHWHVLLRARAIETGCYVFAPAQCGTHVNQRETFGHALIINPWGEILADGGTEPGYVMAEIDPDQVRSIRGKIPSLKHDRKFF